MVDVTINSNMASLLHRCLLLLCLSVFFLLDHSAQACAEASKWSEPRDERYFEQVKKNKRFLTKEGRKSGQLEGGNNDEDHSNIRGQGERALEVDSSVPEMNVLVILLQWKNHPNRNTAVPRESYDKMFNGEGRDADLYPGGSVKEYFEAMSYGEFSVNFQVTDWIMTDYTEQDFTGDGSQGRTPALQEAFRPALESLDDDFFNFRPFDGDFDRNLDLTIFLHSGYDGSIGATDCETGKTNTERVASHARLGALESTWRSKAGYALGPYAVAPAFRETCDLQIGRIGTIVHEMIHLFDVPDLYDVEGGYGTGNIGGIDRFGVMANQAGNSGGDLAWPGHISAWTRYKLGWIKPTPVNTDGVYQLRPVEQNQDMCIITKGFADKEYLLLENRQRIAGDFDEKFMNPGGVVIYHVDENVWDAFDNGGNVGNFPRGGPFQSGWPGNGRHYPVAVLQADGLYELEQGINGGKSDDIWNQMSQVLGPGNGESVASSANYPNSDSYAFGQIKPTGIIIKNFQTRAGKTMSFQVCGLSTTGDCADIIDIDPIDTPIEELENGSCEVAADAFRPEDSLKGIGYITNGTVANTCYDEEEKGVWYKINAGTVPTTENTIRATTCFRETEVESKISVFKGGNCTALECVETKGIACKNGQLGHVVYWEVEENEDYYLFVHSIEESDEISNIEIIGDGAIHLDVVNFAPMKNDNCIEATALTTDGKRVGSSTNRATPALNIDSSDTCGVESAGVWFKVNGTGSELQATTCHPGTTAPTQIHIFTGSCDSLSCVSVEANNYAACPIFESATFSATVNWQTEEGVEYFILVGSRDGSGGVFEVSVSEINAAENDQCPNAIAFDIVEDKLAISGSNANATNDFPYGEYCGAPLDTAGVWYTIEGTGEGLSFSTCGQNDYNSAISIFTGSDCGELECLTGISTRDPACNFGGVTAAWLSEEGETYHVYVHGSAQNSYGTFELEAEKFEVLAENEFCSQAVAITDAGVYVRSSTLDASYSAPTNVCGAEAVKPGLWYTFEGTGSPFFFSGCPLSDNLDLSVSFFSGTSCGDLACVDGETFTIEDCKVAADQNRLLQNGSGNPADFVSLESVEGLTYYMVIHGQARPDPETGEVTDGVGEFDFTFFSGVTPPTSSGPPTGLPTASPTTVPTSSPTNAPLRKKFDRRKLMYILLGIGAFLLIIFCIIPCWIYREKLFGRCRKSYRNADDESSWWDPTKPPDDLDMEEAPFSDERSSRQMFTSDDRSSRQSSVPESASTASSDKKHRWQTLSWKSS